MIRFCNKETENEINNLIRNQQYGEALDQYIEASHCGKCYDEKMLDVILKNCGIEKKRKVFREYVSLMIGIPEVYFAGYDKKNQRVYEPLSTSPSLLAYIINCFEKNGIVINDLEKNISECVFLNNNEKKIFLENLKKYENIWKFIEELLLILRDRANDPEYENKYIEKLVLKTGLKQLEERIVLKRKINKSKKKLQRNKNI